jgi:multisubunit Na+/H+ antiporter MnhB subunit
MTRQLLAVVACAGLLAALGWALLSLPTAPAGLSSFALAQLPESGVRNPVTAALLNYRSYDTLLEMAVLLAAVVGVWSIRRGEWPAGDWRERPLLTSLLRVLLPTLVLVAAYLLWVGAFAPGGAFQGGALLGGGLVLAMLGNVAPSALYRVPWLRAGLVLGVLVFAGVAWVTLAATGCLLQYPRGTGGTWILIIESAALLSIGLALGLLYLGGRPDLAPADSTERDSSHE